MSTRTKEYILTESGNRISRTGLNLVNTQSIVLGGKTILESHVTIRGDLKRAREAKTQQSGVDAAVSVGRYCLLSHHATLSPPYKVRPINHQSSTSTTDTSNKQDENTQDKSGEEKVYFPMKIGDYVHIGAHSRIEAASVSSCVHIGAHVTIGNMSIIKEGSVIDDYTVLPPYSVVAPLSRVSGKPGLVVDECPEVMVDVTRERLREHYAKVLAGK